MHSKAVPFPRQLENQELLGQPLGILRTTTEALQAYRFEGKQYLRNILLCKY